MRIVLHGQQAFGQAVLEKLLDRGEDVVGVCCAPTKEGKPEDPCETREDMSEGTCAGRTGREGSFGKGRSEGCGAAIAGAGNAGVTAGAGRAPRRCPRRAQTYRHAGARTLSFFCPFLRNKKRVLQSAICRVGAELHWRGAQRPQVASLLSFSSPFLLPLNSLIKYVLN